MKIKVSEVVFRKDLYPRIEHNQANVCFGDMFPSVCPRGMEHIEAGVIREGMFYPSGSVARHYWKLEKESPVMCQQQDVYIIQAGISGPVKIGLAADVEMRLAALQTANYEELRVIKVFQGGGEDLEFYLHRKFKNLRIRGEWFSFSEEMMKGYGDE